MTPWNRHRLLVIKNRRKRQKCDHVWDFDLDSGTFDCSVCHHVIPEWKWVSVTTDAEMDRLLER